MRLGHLEQSLLSVIVLCIRWAFWYSVCMAASKTASWKWPSWMPIRFAHAFACHIELSNAFHLHQGFHPMGRILFLAFGPPLPRITCINNNWLTESLIISKCLLGWMKQLRRPLPFPHGIVFRMTMNHQITHQKMRVEVLAHLILEPKQQTASPN